MKTHNKKPTAPIVVSDGLIDAIENSPAVSMLTAYLTSKPGKIVLGQWTHGLGRHAEHSLVLNDAYTLRTVYRENATQVLRFYFSKNAMPEVEVAASVIAGKGIPAVLEDLDKINALQESLQLI